MNSTSITDELVKLNELRQEGVLTQEEFDLQKERLINHDNKPENSHSKPNHKKESETDEKSSKVDIQSVKRYQVLKSYDKHYDVEFTLKDDSKKVINITKEKFVVFTDKFDKKTSHSLPLFIISIFVVIALIWSVFPNKQSTKKKNMADAEFMARVEMIRERKREAKAAQTINYTQNKKSILSSVEKAFVVCSFVEQTDSRLSCDVSGFNSSVDVKVLTSPEVAEKMCSKFRNSLLRNGYYFEAGWEIRIFSPLNDSRPIASCYLPN